MRAAQRLHLQHHAGAAAVGAIVHRAVQVGGVVARVEVLDLEHPALQRPPHHAVRQRLAHHQRKQSHDRNTHARFSRRRRRPSPRPPAAPANPPAAGAAAPPVPNIPAPRAPPSARAPAISTKCCTTPKSHTLEIHHLAADQIGAVKVLVVARGSSLRGTPIWRALAAPAPRLDPRLPPTSRSAARRCGRWLRLDRSARRRPGAAADYDAPAIGPAVPCTSEA